MSKDDQEEQDGMSPDEEVGADGCEAEVDRCCTPLTGGDAAEQCSFSADDELAEMFPIEPIPVVMGADGLPDIVTTDPELAVSVPFAYDTVLCIEDARQYVELFLEDLRVGNRGWSHRYDGTVHWRPEGYPQDSVSVIARVRYDRLTGKEQTRRAFSASSVKHGWGVSWVYQGEEQIPVRPIRERCRYYKRQVVSNDEIPDRDEFGHQIVFRNCTARRSNGGAHMTLRDQGIYACDYRDPPDEGSAKTQDEKDQNTLEKRPQDKRVPMFGIGE